MKLSLMIVLLFSLMMSGKMLFAQRVAFTFQPYTWEQASMLAARENKLVFVDVVSSGGSGKTVGSVFTDKLVQYFLERNTVAIRVDMSTEAGRMLAPKLLMHKYPLYGFFMPYGDLLTAVEPAAAAKNTELLRETGREALKVAAVKKSNSRSVRFENISLPEALVKARKEDKLIFIDAYRSDNQSCLLMEKNVFNLDRVADFYNKHFINLRINFGQEKELAVRYGVSDYPAFLFLNGDGKLVSLAGGYTGADLFVEKGEVALKKAEGIVFTKGSWEQVVQQARQSGRLVFMDFYASSDGERKLMAKEVYRDPEVAGLFNDKFVNTVWSTDVPESAVLKQKYGVESLPVICFVDVDGNMVHRMAGGLKADELMREANRALENRGIAYMTAEYVKGNRESIFVEEYLTMLDKAGLDSDAQQIGLVYLSGMDPKNLHEKKYWDLFQKYMFDVDSELFRYVYANRKEFYTFFGEQEVKAKLTAVWSAGANRFLKNGIFDEAGFKGYIKRMKTEKVEGWRDIVHGAQMNVAEKTGDWKTYVELAEERWNEGKVPDAELYDWGVKINQQCTDKGIRYKAARWFAFAADEIARKEVQSGKVNLTSYKGFFEKLVDDLVRK